MSYDIYLAIDTGMGELSSVSEVGNHTSNTVGIWAHAIGFPLADMDGKGAGTMIPFLKKAIEKLSAPSNREFYLKGEPKNGWGSLKSATEYLQKLLQQCRRHPACTIVISC